MALSRLGDDIAKYVGQFLDLNDFISAISINKSWNNNLWNQLYKQWRSYFDLLALFEKISSETNVLKDPLQYYDPKLPKDRKEMDTNPEFIQYKLLIETVQKACDLFRSRSGRILLHISYRLMDTQEELNNFLKEVPFRLNLPEDMEENELEILKKYDGIKDKGIKDKQIQKLKECFQEKRESLNEYQALVNKYNTPKLANGHGIEKLSADDRTILKRYHETSNKYQRMLQNLKKQYGLLENDLTILDVYDAVLEKYNMSIHSPFTEIFILKKCTLSAEDRHILKTENLSPEERVEILKRSNLSTKEISSLDNQSRSVYKDKLEKWLNQLNSAIQTARIPQYKKTVELAASKFEKETALLASLSDPAKSVVKSVPDAKSAKKSKVLDSIDRETQLAVVNEAKIEFQQAVKNAFYLFYLATSSIKQVFIKRVNYPDVILEDPDAFIAHTKRWVPKAQAHFHYLQRFVNSLDELPEQDQKGKEALRKLLIKQLSTSFACSIPTCQHAPTYGDYFGMNLKQGNLASKKTQIATQLTPANQTKSIVLPTFLDNEYKYHLTYKNPHLSAEELKTFKTKKSLKGASYSALKFKLSGILENAQEEIYPPFFTCHFTEYWTTKEATSYWGLTINQLHTIPSWDAGRKRVYLTQDLIELRKNKPWIVLARNLVLSHDLEKNGLEFLKHLRSQKFLEKIKALPDAIKLVMRLDSKKLYPGKPEQYLLHFEGFKFQGKHRKIESTNRFIHSGWDKLKKYIADDTGYFDADAYSENEHKAPPPLYSYDPPVMMHDDDDAPLEDESDLEEQDEKTNNWVKRNAFSHRQPSGDDDSDAPLEDESDLEEQNEQTTSWTKSHAFSHKQPSGGMVKPGLSKKRAPVSLDDDFEEDNVDESKSGLGLLGFSRTGAGSGAGSGAASSGNQQSYHGIYSRLNAAKSVSHQAAALPGSPDSKERTLLGFKDEFYLSQAFDTPRLLKNQFLDISDFNNDDFGDPADSDHEPAYPGPGPGPGNNGFGLGGQ